MLKLRRTIAKKKIRFIEHFRDINFTVTASIHNTTKERPSVHFQIYEMETNGKIVDVNDPASGITWHCACEEDFMNFYDAEKLSKADISIVGEISSNGENDWDFNAKICSPTNFMGKKDLIAFNTLLLRCWDIAARICPKWNPDPEYS